MSPRTRPPITRAPPEVFQQILTYMVLPTFDVAIEVPGGGILLVRRKIPPYRNQWALPGLRMCKPEGIDDTIRRVARDEVGLRVNPAERRFLGQFVGRFTTEHGRQDISTGYVVTSATAAISLNRDHFSGCRMVHSLEEVPRNTGAMYRFYLSRYFSNPAGST